MDSCDLFIKGKLRQMRLSFEPYLIAIVGRFPSVSPLNWPVLPPRGDQATVFCHLGITNYLTHEHDPAVPVRASSSIPPVRPLMGH